MRLQRFPKLPKLKKYIPKKTILHIIRLKQDFETVRSWLQKYPYLGAPEASFEKLYNSYSTLIPKLETLNETARLANSKRSVSAKTASRNSGPNPWADGDGTRGWLGELSKDSETSSKFPRSFLLHRRSFEHSIKDSDYKVNVFEIQERAGNPKKDKLTTNIAYLPKIGIACRSKPSVAPTECAKPINSNSKGLEWNLPGHNVIHGRGIISTIFSNLMAMPSQKSDATQVQMQRLELIGCGSKNSGFVEERVLELLDLAVINYLQDLSREQLLNAALTTVKESFLPACHMAIFFEIQPLESEDAAIMHEVDKSQIPDSEGGGPDLAQKHRCDGARQGKTQNTTLSDEVQRTTVINVFVGYIPSVIQSLSREDSV